MVSVIVFLKYNGCWDENKRYIDNKFMGILVPIVITILTIKAI